MQLRLFYLLPRSKDFQTAKIAVSASRKFLNRNVGVYVNALGISNIKTGILIMIFYLISQIQTSKFYTEIKFEFFIQQSLPQDLMAIQIIILVCLLERMDTYIRILASEEMLKLYTNR